MVAHSQPYAKYFAAIVLMQIGLGEACFYTIILPSRTNTLKKMARNLRLFPKLTAVERVTLEEMGAHHHYAAFRLRAKGILSLDAGYKPAIVAAILGKSPQSVYNWAKKWREVGLAGILDGNKGSPPTKLTPAMLDTAEAVAAQAALTLDEIKRRVRAEHPQAPDFSVRRLSAGLKMRGWSFKRTRLSLKKTGRG